MGEVDGDSGVSVSSLWCLISEPWSKVMERRNWLSKRLRMPVKAWAVMSAWKHHGLRYMAVSMVGGAHKGPPKADVA